MNRRNATDPGTSMEAYRYPQYYDIAFAVADAAREVAFFEAAIRRFSRTPVHRVFEIACGTAPYLAEWQRRGYRYCGLDLNPAMLDVARAKATRLDIAADFVEGDMRDFDRDTVGPVDLAYVLLGSIYVGSNREFLGHLERVADGLTPGGLYLLDSVVWFEIFSDYRRRWTRRRGGITVRMTYRAEVIDPIAQTYHECVTLDVDDHGTVHKIEGRVPTKIFFPQEFLCLVEASRQFEFVGWFNDFDLAAPVTAKGRHTAILRRL
jgi:SAM-dependent methyltransferase